LASDQQYDALINNISTTLESITALLNNPTTSDDGPALNALYSQLQGYLTQLQSATLSPAGVVQYADDINNVLADDLPQNLAAVIQAVQAQLTSAGLASNTLKPVDYFALAAPTNWHGPADMYAGTRPAFFGLIELLGITSIESSLSARLYGGVMVNIYSNLALIGASHLAQQYLNATTIDGLITGGDTEVQAFNIPGSILEVTDPAFPRRNRIDLYIIGPGATGPFAAAYGAVTNLTSIVKNLTSGLVKETFDGLHAAAVVAATPQNTVDPIASLLYSINPTPDSSVNITDGVSCFFFNNPCTDYTFNNGFSNGGLVGVSQIGAVTFLYRNQTTNQWQIGTFIFSP
jgi:hypothetical protein